jgi:hypothetical protein
MNEYQQSAIKFLKDHDVKVTIGDPTFGLHFDDDTKGRYIFPCRLQRSRNSYSFKFGQSIAEGSNKPSVYDILTCLLRTDPGDFQEFCDEYGYNVEDKEHRKLYKRVIKEYEGMSRLFSEDELDLIYEVEDGEY